MTNIDNQVPTSKRLSNRKLFLAQTICIVSVIAITCTLFLYTTIKNDVEEIQQKDFDRRMQSYEALVNQFIQLNMHFVRDASTHPDIAQSAIQPRFMKEILHDHMSRIQLMGKDVQLTLLDVKGKIIHSTLSSPDFNYQEHEGIKGIIGQSRTQYIGIHSDKDQYYITFAVGISIKNKTIFYYLMKNNKQNSTYFFRHQDYSKQSLTLPSTRT